MGQTLSVHFCYYRSKYSHRKTQQQQNNLAQFFIHIFVDTSLPVLERPFEDIAQIPWDVSHWDH